MQMRMKGTKSIPIHTNLTLNNAENKFVWIEIKSID